MFGKQYCNICQRYQLNSLFLVLLIVNNDCTWVKFELFQIVTVWPWKGWLDFFYTCLCLHMQMGKRWVFFFPEDQLMWFSYLEHNEPKICFCFVLSISHSLKQFSIISRYILSGLWRFLLPWVCREWFMLVGWIKSIVEKSDYLTLIPGTHMKVERENWHIKFSLIFIHGLWQVWTCCGTMVKSTKTVTENTYGNLNRKIWINKITLFPTFS